MNEKIIQLMERPDIEIPLGSNTPLIDLAQPAESEASDFIIKKAHQVPANKFLNLVILGSCTNVASAILKDPSIIPKIKVHYIGFWYDKKTGVFDKNEFNSGNDSLAVKVLLKNTAGLDLDVMTATTCQHLVFNKEKTFVELSKRGEVGAYLIDRWKTYNRWWTKADPEKNQWIMWDVAIIEALAHPDLAVKKEFSGTEGSANYLFEAYTSIEVEEMIEDFWISTEVLLY